MPVKQSKTQDIVDILMQDGALQETLSRIGVFAVDYKDMRSFTNSIWKEVGYDPALNQTLAWMDLLHPDDRGRVETNLQEIFHGKHDFFREVFRIKDPAGGWRWIAHRGDVVYRDEEGKPWLFIGADEDLTRIKEVQEEASLRAREAETLSASIEVITSSLDLDETVRRVTEQARRVVPYDRATIQILHDGQLEVLGGSGFSDPALIKGLRFPYPEEGSLSTRAIRERHPWMSNDVSEDFPRFVQVDSVQPSHSWIGAPLIAHGDVIGLMSFDSIQKNFYSERHLELARAFAGPVAIALENARLHEETYKLAMEDALTGIGSRHAFELNSRYLFEKIRREGRILSVGMLDIDRFKQVNDEFGHPVGDVVLQYICKACENGLRASDLIARYGGEEIVILFPDTRLEQAADILERIRLVISELEYPGVNRPVTVSAGVSGSTQQDISSMADLIREADLALYRAKSHGRNRIMIAGSP